MPPKQENKSLPPSPAQTAFEAVFRDTGLFQTLEEAGGYDQWADIIATLADRPKDADKQSYQPRERSSPFHINTFNSEGHRNALQLELQTVSGGMYFGEGELTQEPTPQVHVGISGLTAQSRENLNDHIGTLRTWAQKLEDRGLKDSGIMDDMRRQASDIEHKTPELSIKFSFNRAWLDGRNIRSTTLSVVTFNVYPVDAVTAIVGIGADKRYYHVPDEYRDVIVRALEDLYRALPSK